jgi:hypothetical protein
MLLRSTRCLIVNPLGNASGVKIGSGTSSSGVDIVGPHRSPAGGHGWKALASAGNRPARAGQ